MKTNNTHTGGRGSSGNSWWWCGTRFSKSWPYFRPKNVILHTRFQTWPLGRNYVIITLNANQNIFQIHFEFAHLSFLSFFSIYLELKRLKRWIRSYTHIVPSKTIPDSRPKWAKCIFLFKPKRRKNPTRSGGTYLYSLYKGVPPPPQCLYFLFMESACHQKTSWLGVCRIQSSNLSRLHWPYSLREVLSPHSFLASKYYFIELVKLKSFLFFLDWPVNHEDSLHVF